MALPASMPTPEEERRKRQQSLLQAVKTTRSGLNTLAQGKPHELMAKAIYSGVKMASEVGPSGPFFDRLVNPLTLAEECRKRWGITWLSWSPETLCSMIDRTAGLWSHDRAGEALQKFQASGDMDTEVPALVRQKLYAIRVIATSDSAQNDWAIFEKIGAVFNDRTADFAVLQKMSAAECARTVAIIESIRPDTYGSQIHSYVGACCAEDGLLTVSPVKWLAWAEEDLQRFNRENGIAAPAETLTASLKTKMSALRVTTQEPDLEDPITAQALKLLAVELYAEEVLETQSPTG